MKRTTDDREGALSPRKEVRREDEGGGRGGGSSAGAGRGRGPASGGRGEGRPAGEVAPLLDLPAEAFITMALRVKKQFSGLIIGPGGENAKLIRRQAHCKLHVQRDILPGDMQVVELHGTANQVMDGLRVVRDLMHNSDPNAFLEEPAEVSTVIEVVPEMVGSVLGAKGATIKKIRDATGANVRVEGQPADGNQMQTITITGGVGQVQEGYRTVRAILARFDPERVRGAGPVAIVGGGAGRGGGGGGPRRGRGGEEGRGGGRGEGGYGGGRGGGRGPPMGRDPYDDGRGAPRDYAPRQMAPRDMGYGGRPEYQGPPQGYGGQYGGPGGYASDAHEQWRGAPAQSGAGGPPKVLLLQPDGTYQPAPVVNYQGPSAGREMAAPQQAYNPYAQAAPVQQQYYQQAPQAAAAAPQAAAAAAPAGGTDLAQLLALLQSSQSANGGAPAAAAQYGAAGQQQAYQQQQYAQYAQPAAAQQAQAYQQPQAAAQQQQYAQPQQVPQYAYNPAPQAAAATATAAAAAAGQYAQYYAGQQQAAPVAQQQYGGVPAAQQQYGGVPAAGGAAAQGRLSAGGAAQPAAEKYRP